MSGTQRNLTITLWVLAVLAMISLVASGFRSRTRPSLPEFWPVPPFSLTDQNGAGFDDQRMRGKVWIADFVFTRCAGPCPLMTAQMAKLQKSLPQADIHFLAISVDPTHDTPGVLKTYAAEQGLDPQRTRLLTGDEKSVYQLALDLKISALPAGGNNPIIHSSRFILIDQRGTVRGHYSMEHSEQIASLKQDAESLIQAD
jgi:cytochrome oxidase Cu insertion factor (SCO1/SenC/PrrC family)